ncbi:MAG: hypothetical protein ACUVRX_11075, partial [Actinomycetota bacterium]
YYAPTNGLSGRSFIDAMGPASWLTRSGHKPREILLYPPLRKPAEALSPLVKDLFGEHVSQPGLLYPSPLSRSIHIL